MEWRCRAHVAPLFDRPFLVGRGYPFLKTRLREHVLPSVGDPKKGGPMLGFADPRGTLAGGRIREVRPMSLETPVIPVLSQLLPLEPRVHLGSLARLAVPPDHAPQEGRGGTEHGNNSGGVRDDYVRPRTS